MSKQTWSTQWLPAFLQSLCMACGRGSMEWRMPLFLPFDMAKRWVEEELSVEAYKEILNYEMPSEALDYHPVFSIRTPKPRPDEKGKDEYYEWEKLPELSLE